jgi:hypothetical protein
MREATRSMVAMHGVTRQCLASADTMRKSAEAMRLYAALSAGKDGGRDDRCSVPPLRHLQQAAPAERRLLP